MIEQRCGKFYCHCRCEVYLLRSLVCNVYRRSRRYRFHNLVSVSAKWSWVEWITICPHRGYFYVYLILKSCCFIFRFPLFRSNIFQFFSCILSFKRRLCRSWNKWYFLGFRYEIAGLVFDWIILEIYASKKFFWLIWKSKISSSVLCSLCADSA